jgi:CHAT domain-containing protein
LSGDLHGEDGLLTMSEVVETMDINAQLAVLSACNTAGESAEANNGEGFAGLTRAFMYAGAQGVVVSHWSVDSRSTQELMTELFREARDGAESLSALDGARQKIRASKMPSQGVQQFVSRAHPFYWAPFVYVGD